MNRYSSIFLGIFLFSYTFFLDAQQIDAPHGIAVRDNGVVLHKYFPTLASDHSMDDFGTGDNVYLFQCCLQSKKFFFAIALSYQDDSFSVPTSDWTYSIDFDLYLNGIKKWNSTLELDMTEQKLMSFVFHDISSSINAGNSYIKITNVSTSGKPPLSNIKVEAKLFKEASSEADPTSIINVTYNPTNYSINWSDAVPFNHVVDEYDLEWVIFDENETTPTSSTAAFLERVGTRVNTRQPSYKVNQLFTTGTLFYRVRRISYDPDNPKHRIVGDWNHGNSTTVINTANQQNWQQVITFAENGKNKKVLTIYDETLRPTITATNLNHENSTLIAQSKYDYEGRKVVDFLPFATEGWDPNELVSFPWNSFDKSGFDNGTLPNAQPNTKASANYYDTHIDPSVPRASVPGVAGEPDKNYSYAQTQFTNDNSGRVTKQSGVGEAFHIDGDKNTKYFYGSAAKKELSLLFGTTNLGDANHYRKNFIQDPNGQVSVTYLDPQGRTIATALAGESPTSLAQLPSFPLENPSIEVDLSSQYTIATNGIRSTYYKVLNSVPGTPYDFSYLFSSTADDLGSTFGCQSCKYDVEISIFDALGNPIDSFSENDLLSSDCVIPAQTSWSESVTLDSVGEYTITKKITPHKLTFSEAYEIVSTSSQVIDELEIIEINEPPIDVTLCEIEILDNAADILPELAREVATSSCEAIKSQIITDLMDGSGDSYQEINDDFDNRAQTHESYCHYQFCIQNIESDVFDAELFLVEDWETASAIPGYTNLFARDVFFNDVELAGVEYRENMEVFINNYDVAPGTSNHVGSLLAVTDPNNPNMRKNTDGGLAGVWNKKHILYATILNGDAPNKSELIDKMRWVYYRSFYLEAKNRVKIQIASDQACTSLRNSLQRADPATYLNNDGDITSIISYANGTNANMNFLRDITDEELDAMVEELKGFACDSITNVPFENPLTSAEETTIKNLLRDFFNSQPLNINRTIPIQLFDSPPLDEIKQIVNDAITDGELCQGIGWLSFVTNYSSGGDECFLCNASLYDISIEIAKYRAECITTQTEIRNDEIRKKQEEFITDKVTEFLENYSCTENITESFHYSFTPKEYHHTLYYYDRAGNLIQTVPPEGVNTGGEGNHSLKTTYRYNSLNQLVEQNSPDGGITKFRYDSKGQLRVSQNAKQANTVPKEYSYTKYDPQGRIKEVGQFSDADVLDVEVTLANLNNPDYPSAGLYELTEQTKTFYDIPNDPSGFAQEYVRGRVSHVEVYLNETTKQAATYYSYDPHGNVKSLLQDIVGFTPKRIDYAYDLVSGNVNYVIYQYGKEDQFYHKYTYDGDNRLTLVETSIDGVFWNREAVYQYHKHGPLRRVELGEGQNLQGLDYYYTLQGWLKGVNAPLTDDPGDDENFNFGRDVLGFTLGYYDGDFTGGEDWTDLDERDKLWNRFDETIGGTGLYNGNISWMNTWLKGVGDDANDDAQGMQAMLYRYDQLNRIVKARGLSEYRSKLEYPSDYGYQSRNATAAFDTDYSYDANGNLDTLKRKDHNALISENLAYVYEPNSNKLANVKGKDHEVKNYTSGAMQDDGNIYPTILAEGDVSVPSGSDVTLEATQSIVFKPGFIAKKGSTLNASITSSPATTSFDVGNYTYDAIGNMITDNDQGVNIDWTVYGKVDKVRHAGGNVVDYTYDAAGNRVMKSYTRDNTITNTFYIRDASGNIMAVYDGNDTDGYELKEMPIYGSSRLGNYTGGGEVGAMHLNQRRYEVSNHLGNVMSTISDELRVDDAGEREVVVTSASDYYPFGMAMPGRSLSASSYRYGFNGKEKDDNGEFGSTVYDYGFRIYNPQIAKFLSVDPLTRSYPWYTPYQFAGNMPIWAIDLDGLEPAFGLGIVKGMEGKPAPDLETAFDVRRGVSNMAFTLGFDHYLPQRFLRQYSYGNGETYIMSEREMIDTNPLKTGIQGSRLKADNGEARARFQEILNGIESGQSKQIKQNVLGGTLTSGALGNFQVIFEGTLSKDENGGWSFDGTMQFYDEWDFNVEGSMRSGAGQDVVEFAGKYLIGEKFNIESDKIPVKQKSTDKYVDWFDDKDPVSVPNRVYKNQDYSKDLIDDIK